MSNLTNKELSNLIDELLNEFMIRSAGLDAISGVKKRELFVNITNPL